MNTSHALCRNAVALALALASGLAAGANEGDEIARLTRPESAVGFGIGYLDVDARRFGQYSGLNERGAYGLLDAEIVRRDDATGTWLRFTGRNLGLDSRELRFEHSRQGNWGYFVEFDQIPRFEPFIPVTAVTGIGTPNLTIPGAPTTGTAVELKTRRDRLTLGFEKYFVGNLDLRVQYRNENKDGARIFGRGTTGAVSGFAGNFEFAPEPINSTTHQLEATVGYTGERLQLSAGYYGTAYHNQYNGLFIAGGVAALGGGASPFTPIALPPDNQSHQLHLTGGYSFTPTTRGTFKLAYARATQHDPFLTAAQLAPTPLAPGIGADLQGRVDTTLAQLGLTARPLPKLSLRASVRYEDRDDKTPIRRFFNVATSTTATGDNEPRSIRSLAGRLEASYALPLGLRLTGGLDYDEKHRNTSSVRAVSHRDRTEEVAGRIELRRSMSDTVTGALAYVHSERDGSPFLITTLTTGAVGSNLIAPVHLANRDRDKLRLALNWTPTDPLAIQLFLEEARDRYDGRDGSILGPRKGRARNYALDATYTFSENWQLTAWASRNDTRMEQATCVNASASGVCPATAAQPLWQANLRNLGESVGLGLRGKPYAWLEIGAELNHSDINDEYRQSALTPGASVASLPDVSTKLTRLNLFAQYGMQRDSTLRLDYIYDRFSTDDWTWSTWRYVDGTRLLQSPTQKVHFIGLSFQHRWR
jgi:MtrB/PioB family decaheme-associated outer membrane protein